MKCAHFLKKHCLSCDLLSQEYLSSIKIKEQKCLTLFPDHANRIKPAVIVEGGVAGTRNKAKLAVAQAQGELSFGFYDSARWFKKLEDCPLHAPAINAILVELKQQLTTFKISPYDLETRKGELKYVIITYSDYNDELMLRFVLRSTAMLSQLKKLAACMTEINPSVKVITANIQSTHQAILEGDEEIGLTERDCIAHQFDDITLYQGPRSFFQTNAAMALKLYQQFQQELSAFSVHSLLDLYCGVGAFSYFGRRHCERVVGVEISEAAIHYAKKAAEVNAGQPIHFIAGDVEVYLRDQLPLAYDAIIVNPPRRGLNEVIITHLQRLAPAVLFYSSCDVDTLHRDLTQLSSQYEIQSLQLFDMFPYTSHFETLAVLTRRL